jgi:hypothetical protein
MPKELFNQVIKTVVQSTDRMPVGIPSQEGCDNIIVNDFFKYLARAAGDVPVVTGSNTINFSSDFGTTNYSITIFDENGIGIQLSSKGTDHFIIDALSGGFINYIAIRNI